MTLEQLIDFCNMRVKIHEMRSKSLEKKYKERNSDIIRVKHESALSLMNTYQELASVLKDIKLIDDLKPSIKNLKKTQESPNMDYYTGYMSALSAVEGVIAILEGNNENERGTNDNKKQSEDGSETVG